MRAYSIYIFSAVALILFLSARLAFAEARADKNFDSFINNATDGSSFDQAVLLKDECDYSRCRNRACLEQVFDDTVYAQELKYASEKFGQRGKDWDVVGNSEVDAYDFAQDTYYDDLGIQLFSTGKKIVLHFDITSSVETFQQKRFSFKK
jgi:hypothetical protein